MGRSFRTEPDELPKVLSSDELSRAQSKEEWISEAPIVQRRRATPRVGIGFARDEQPSINFNLRLNNYERALLAHAAEQGHRSMQAEAKRVLFAELERLLNGSTVEPRKIRRRAESKPKKAG